MVFYFTSSDGYTIYMGRDKFENEDLIRYGLPEDVWFHVDKLSSAHVYLRQNKGEKLDDIPPELLKECATLVKANSIEGCKLKRVDVVYTKWKNLKKTGNMVAGQVGFNDESRVRKTFAIKDNAIVNALNRTKEERYPDLAAEQEERAAEHRREQREILRKQQEEEKEEKRKREEDKKLRSYETLMEESKMTSNAQFTATADASAATEFEDDFM